MVFDFGLITPAFAHGGAQEVTYSTLAGDTARWSVNTATVATVIIVLLVAAAIIIKKPSDTLKKILFSAIAGVIVITTLALSGLTIYLNTASFSGGPVHWHADYEIWACGEKLNLHDPEGFSNKVGSSTVHEHNDDRMHIEGVVVEQQDAETGNFWQNVDVKISEDSLIVPTHDGLKMWQYGDDCGGQSGQVQAFVYTVQNKIMRQRKVDDINEYLISPHQAVPPGDCIIVEFDTPKAKTDKLCQSYELARESGKIR